MEIILGFGMTLLESCMNNMITWTVPPCFDVFRSSGLFDQAGASFNSYLSISLATGISISFFIIMFISESCVKYYD